MWDAIAFGALIKAKRGQRGLTQAGLAARILGSEDRKGEISQIENGKITPQEDTIQRYLDFFEISEAEMAPIRMARPTAEQLRDIPALSREALQNLAARFGLDDPYGSPDGELRHLLTMKADEYRNLKLEVDQIDESLRRLSNLKAAAQDAIARVDLDEVEELLGRVQEVELEEAAKTAELRAQNALLRGNVDQAYRLLSATADSLAAVDEVEAAKRRLGYQGILFDHGSRFSGPALALSETMARQVTSGKFHNQYPEVFAEAQERLATTLEVRGRRTAGADGIGLLKEAVEAHQAAQAILSRTEHPFAWAIVTRNLAGALTKLGVRIGKEAGIERLSEAVEAYRNALHVVTEYSYPIEWAWTMQNLAGALRTLANHKSGEPSQELIGEAVEAYRSALRVSTESAHPLQWATTMQNLGVALRNQGMQTADEAGAALLAEALEAFRAALRVHTMEAYPVDWAMTQENMAIAEEALASHDATENPRAHREAALAYAENALQIYDPEHMSYDYETASQLRDSIQAALDALDET